MNDYISHLRNEKRYSQHSIVAYQSDLSQFSEFLLCTFEFSDILSAKSLHIRSYIVHLSENGLANKSINRKISALRSYYQYAKRTHQLEKNPCHGIPALKVPKRLPQVTRQSEMSKLRLVVLKGDLNFEKLRDYCLMEVFYQTGMRRSELIHLKVSDIDFSNLLLKVLGKGNKERIIPFSNQLKQILNEYLVYRDEIETSSMELFISDKGKKLYPKAVYNIVKKYLSLISTIEQKSPHMLRHSFATHLMDEGADLNAVKNLLGHSSLAATQIYTHNTIEQLRNIYMKAHPKGE